MKRLLLFLCSVPIIAVGTHVGSAQSEVDDAWTEVVNIIDSSDLNNLVVVIGDERGVLLSHTKGSLGLVASNSPNQRIPIASSSKWFTSATIMQLVENNVMSLDDTPQAYIDWWTSDPTDWRSQITLDQLLSFTSGFQGEHHCIMQANAAPEACAREIYEDYHRYEPGTSFFYSSTHMHIAGVMASKATDQPFNDLFRELIADPVGMSTTTRYERPSTTNPFLAGGAVSTANDYAMFLQALLTGDLLADSQSAMYQDWTAEPIEIVASPLQDYWHYGLGVWRECYDESGWTDACNNTLIVSSGGGLGWFPWIDVEAGYYGVIARRGLPLTGAVGPSVELSYELRPHIIKALQVTQ